jgi:4-amino-4-deoxy-L-arabinose transferase-like glycosyltransferase
LSGGEREMKKAGIYLLIIVVLGSILFFCNLGGRDFWNPDEPRYAEVAKEMLLGEGWLVPHLNNAVYLEKPPLFFWTIAGTARLLGTMNEYAGFIPSALFALFTLILTFLLGKRLCNEKVGFYAALILATTIMFFWLARRANIDTPLTFFTTATIFLFFEGFYRQRGRWIFYALAYCAMALGFLTKIQVAVIVPLLVIGGYFLIQKEFAFFKDRSHLFGLGLFIAVIGGWIVLTSLAGGEDYLRGLLYNRTTARFFTEPSHQEPIYFYLYAFPGDFLPWFLFLPSALIYGLSEKGRSRGFMFAFIWFSLLFVSFSLIKGKRDFYLLPLYPAAALMVGYLWNALSERPERVEKKLFTIPLLLLAIVSVVSAIAVPIVAAIIGPHYLKHPWEIGIVSGLIMGVGGLLCFLAYYYHRLDRALYIIVAMMFAFGLYATIRILPEINVYKSARPLSQSIVRVMRGGDRLGVYQLEGAEYNYYTGLTNITKTQTEEELNNFLRSPHRVFCILRESHYERLKEVFPVQVVVILTGRVGHRHLVVISNRP